MDLATANLERREGGLRILHAAFSVLISGSSRYVCDLGLRQMRAGHVVGAALPPRVAGASIYDSLPASIEVLPVLSRPGWLGLARAVRAFRPDIIHFHDGRGPRALKWLRNAPPSVVTLHLGYKRAMASADGVIAIAKWQNIEDYSGRSTIVRNWRIAGPPVDPAAALRARHSVGAGARGEGRLIGCAVRLHPSKRVDVLIDAFRAVRDPCAILAILSDGPERAALEARACRDARIHFLGMRSDVDVWFRAFDYFVQPSSAEHSPLTLLEAMDAGLPIAAAANPGSAEMLEGQGALLFPVGDVPALGSILEAWLSAPRAGSIAYDLSGFDPLKAVSAIEDFYRDVIAARRRGTNTLKPR